MSKTIAVIMLAALLCLSGAVSATPPDTKSPTVKLKIQNVKLQDGSRQDVIRVGPRGAGVCKKPDPEEEICGGQITFRWVSPDRDRTLIISFEKADLAKQCFGLTDQGHPIRLTRTVDSRTLTIDAASCGLEDKGTLFYTVSCTDAGGGDCGGIKSVDPGVIIEPGGP